jgi:hypothetical protein
MSPERWALLASALLVCWAVAFVAVTLWLALGGLTIEVPA